MTDWVLGLLVGLILGGIVGVVVVRARHRHRDQQHDRQREQHWHQQYEARIETIESYWQQRLDQEREQNQAYTTKFEALQTERTELLTSHQHRLHELEQQHQNTLNQQNEAHHQAIANLTEHNKQAKKASLNTSRLVIKGKVAEQLAPFLPGFHYLPSDARFLGDPIDYVVFDGYSEFKDGQTTAEDLEIVFLEVKTGQAKLTPHQRALSRAIAAGRVRFETVRIQTPNPEMQENPPVQELRSPVIGDVPKGETVSEIEPSMKDDRHAYIRAYQPWLDEEDELLKLRYSQGVAVRAIAAELQREPGAIRSRLRKLGQT